MNLVLPIVLAALLLGLFARRMTPWHWAGLITWITLVVVYHYFKA